MKRVPRLALVFLVPLTLACNFIMQPFNQAQEAVATAEALVTAMPVETLAAIPTVMGEIMPTIEAGMTALPQITGMPDLGDLGQMFDPKGEPVDVWKEIPVMPQAVAGQEFPQTFSYTFRVPATVEDVTTFYDENLKNSGWQSLFSAPPSDGGALLMYTGSGGETLIITITPALNQDGLIVTLQLPQ